MDVISDEWSGEYQCSHCGKMLRVLESELRVDKTSLAFTCKACSEKAPVLFDQIPDDVRLRIYARRAAEAAQEEAKKQSRV